MPNKELSKIIGKILASPYVYAATRVEGYSLGDAVMETLTKFETFDSIPEDYKKLYAMAEFSYKLIEKLDPNYRYAGTLREDQVSPVYLQTLEAFGPNSLELRPTDKLSALLTFNQGDITFYPKAKPWAGRST